MTWPGVVFGAIFLGGVALTVWLLGKAVTETAQAIATIGQTLINPVVPQLPQVGPTVQGPEDLEAMPPLPWDNFPGPGSVPTEAS